MSTVRVWKTIEFDTGIKTPESFHLFVERHNELEGCKKGVNARSLKVSDNAKDTLRQVTFSTCRRKINLIKVSLKQLGFNKETSRKQIYDRAKELDLIECHDETGAQLRLQYLDQPKDERILVGMGAIGFSGFQNLFLLDANKSTIYLRAVFGGENGYWDNEFEWLFALPEKQIIRELFP